MLRLLRNLLLVLLGAGVVAFPVVMAVFWVRAAVPVVNAGPEKETPEARGSGQEKAAVPREAQLPWRRGVAVRAPRGLPRAAVAWQRTPDHAQKVELASAQIPWERKVAAGQTHTELPHADLAWKNTFAALVQHPAANRFETLQTAALPWTARAFDRINQALVPATCRWTRDIAVLIAMELPKAQLPWGPDGQLISAETPRSVSRGDEH